MPAKDDPLLGALDGLERALTAPPDGRGEWEERLDSVLAAAEQGFRRHAEAAESPAGPLAQVDPTRPALIRQVGHLHREHTDLLERILTLRAEARGQRRGTAPDGDAFRGRVGRLAAALRRHHEGEVGLVLESMSTDIGTGD